MVIINMITNLGHVHMWSEDVDTFSEAMDSVVDYIVTGKSKRDSTSYPVEVDFKMKSHHI